SSPVTLSIRDTPFTTFSPRSIARGSLLGSKTAAASNWPSGENASGPPTSSGSDASSEPVETSSTPTLLPNHTVALSPSGANATSDMQKRKEDRDRLQSSR